MYEFNLIYFLGWPARVLEGLRSILNPLIHRNQKEKRAALGLAAFKPQKRFTWFEQQIQIGEQSQSQIRISSHLRIELKLPLMTQNDQVVVELSPVRDLVNRVEKEAPCPY